MTHLFDPYYQTIASTGAPRAGALLYFYQSGTTTAITTYQDSAKGTPHAQPVVADASGMFPPIWVDTTPYKWVLWTSVGGLGVTPLALIQTVDAVYVNNSLTEGRFSIATAATVNLDATEFIQGDLTAANTVSAFTLAEGHFRIARADVAFQITASSSLIVNGSTTVNYTTVAEDRLLIEGNAGGVSKVTVISANMIVANGQIKFPATQNSSSDVNTLDDYEEAAWTPVIQFGGTSVGVTGTQTGTKTGRVVIAHFDITLTNKGSSVGAASIGGLPHAIASIASGIFGFTANLTSLVDGMTLVADNGTNTLLLYTGSATGSVALADTNFANNTRIVGSVTYNAAT